MTDNKRQEFLRDLAQAKKARDGFARIVREMGAKFRENDEDRTADHIAELEAKVAEIEAILVRMERES